VSKSKKDSAVTAESPLAPTSDLRKQAYEAEAATLEQTAQRVTLQIEAMQRDLAAVRGRYEWLTAELAKLA